MKSTLGLLICFFWVFVFADNNQNSSNKDKPDNSLLKSSTFEVSAMIDASAPEVLVQYTISGTVFHSGSPQVPFSGVIMTCSNGVSDTTDEQGHYAILVDRNWSGSVTPYYCDFYNFSPTQKTYISVKVNYPGQDYVGTPTQMFTIAGTITNTNTSLPLANMPIDFGNGYLVTTTSQGHYVIEVTPCSSDTLSLAPTSEDYSFFPISRNYVNLTADVVNQDYEATPTGPSVPPGWDYNHNTGVNPAFISVFLSANPNICGVPLQAGDWIGVFYVGDDGQLHCGGAEIWNDTTNTSVVAVGNDPDTPEKDGFGPFELMNFKVYSYTQTQHEYLAYPVIQSGQLPKWAPLTGYIVTSLPAYKTHNLEIPQGWSGISSYILPRTGTAAVATLTAPILSKLVIMQNLTKTYWPGQNINTIGNWSSTSGYKIKVTAPAILPIIGCDYSPQTLNLVAGWNLIPVLSDCNVQIETLFAANLSKITVIKEIAGSNIYWPAVNIKTLLTLQSGKAYLMSVTQNFSVTFPACAALKDEEIINPVFKNNSPWNDPVMTPSNHAIALPSAVLAQLMVGDVIGAFTEEGVCTGLVQVDDLSQNILLQVFGDDPTTPEKEGYLDNEMMKFKLYRPQTKQEFEIGFEFDATFPSSDGLFTTDGLSAAGKIVFNPTSIGETGNPGISFYPNPGNGLIEFVAGDAHRIFRIIIMDLTGQKTYETTFSGKTDINLTSAPKGIYIVKIESDNLVKVDKLIIQ